MFDLEFAWRGVRCWNGTIKFRAAIYICLYVCVYVWECCDFNLLWKQNCTAPSELRECWSCLFIPETSSMGCPYSSFPNGQIGLHVCDPCFVSLKNKNRPNTLPKFAIRNGFAAGVLPEHLSDCTNMELTLSSRTLTVGSFTTLAFGNYGLRGHTLSVNMDPSQVLENILPLDPRTVAEQIAVVVVSATTPEEEARAKRQTLVRREKVRQLLELYTNSNRLYRDVQVDQNRLNSLPKNDVLEGTFASVEPEALPVEIATSFRRMNESNVNPIASEGSHGFNAGRAEKVTDAGDAGTRCQQKNIAEEIHGSFLVQANLPGTERQRNLEDTRDLLIVRASSELAREHDPKMLLYQFPNLFPFGYGGLDDPTRSEDSRVSKIEWLKHYLKCQNRNFARHPKFLLVTFDQISRAQGMAQSMIAASIPSNHVEQFTTITVEEMTAHVNHMQAVQDSISRGDPIPRFPPIGTLTAQRLERQLKASRRKMFGTNEERTTARNQLWSLWNYFGPPSIFFTLNPYDVGSLEILKFMNLPTDVVNVRSEM
jgi:hypothetical protein